MNKTLKILMAIVLFVAVLAIANCVNAATVDFSTVVNSEEEKGAAAAISKDPTEYSDNKQIYNVTGTITQDFKITSGVVELRLAAGAVLPTNIEILGANTNVTIKGVNSSAVTVNSIIKNEGTLTLKGKLAMAGRINDSGKLIATETGVTLADVQSASASAEIIYHSVLAGVATEKDADIKAATAYYVFKNEDAGYLYVSRPILTNGVSYVKDVDGKKVTTLEAGKTYTVVVEHTYEWDGKTYKSEPWSTQVVGSNLSSTDFEENVKVTTTGDGINTAKVVTFTITKELEGKAFVLKTATVANDGKVKAATTYSMDLNGTVTPTNTPDATTEPTNTPDNTQPTNTPDNTQPTNTPDNTNKGDDLDETPKTGDHIIPATAILAVVVVANVVYFAKMKRN